MMDHPPWNSPHCEEEWMDGMSSVASSDSEHRVRHHHHHHHFSFLDDHHSCHHRHKMMMLSSAVIPGQCISAGTSDIHPSEVCGCVGDD